MKWILRFLSSFCHGKLHFKIFYNKIITLPASSKILAKFGTTFIGKNIVHICLRTFKDSGQSENIYISFFFVLIKISSSGLLPELPLHSNSHNVQIVISRLILNFFILFLIWEANGLYQILVTVLNYSSSEVRDTFLVINLSKAGKILIAFRMFFRDCFPLLTGSWSLFLAP